MSQNSEAVRRIMNPYKGMIEWSGPVPILTPSYHPVVSQICSVICACLVIVFYDGYVKCWTVVTDIYDAMGAQGPRAFQLTEEHWSLKALLRSVI